jgi:hypothetical protein
MISSYQSSVRTTHNSESESGALLLQVDLANQLLSGFIDLYLRLGVSCGLLEDSDLCVPWRTLTRGHPLSVCSRNCNTGKIICILS